MKPFAASIVVLSALVAAPVAEAQEWRPSRPYRGLFAGGVGETQHLLTISASAGGGWDKNLVTGPDGRNLLLGEGNSRFQGGATTGSATLSYSFSGDRAQIGMSAGTTARYYPRLSDPLVRREYASLGAFATLGGGFSLRGNASYQPYSLKSLYPGLYEPVLGDPAIVDLDFPDSNEDYVSYLGSLGFSRAISPRNTFSADYSYQGRPASGSLSGYDRHSGAVRLRRALTRDLGLRIGYGYSKALYGSGRDNFGSHLIDVGFDYDRGLSISRRAKISFGSGTTASRRLGSEIRMHVTGSAGFSYEIARTWNAAISYNRGLQFVDTWPEPIFSDAVIAGVSGLLNSRTQLSVSARGLEGRGYDENVGKGRTYSGVAGLSVAITRHISTGITYAYYRHKFTSGTVLAPGFPNEFDGQTIRASVSVWAPLFQSARRP